MSSIPANPGALFEPRSIAILGASEDERRFGGIPLRNLILHGFSGRLIPINPKYDQVRGLPCYASVLDAPGEVDTAILSLPTHAVMPTLRECAQKRVKLAIVVSAGFAEAGNGGRAAQQEMTELGRAAGMRILGPNCLGFLNAPASIAATAGAALGVPRIWPGTVSLVAHSGAMGFSSVFARANDRGIGFRYVVSSGNECDLHAAELLQLFAADPLTRVLVASLEGLRDPAGFREAAEAAAGAAKPLVVLKVGRSEEGSRAAAAHTAALAGSDDVHDAVFKSHGVVRVHDLDDLWEVPALFASGRLPAGRRIGVVTTTGGMNGLLADHLRLEGLELPELSSETRAILSRVLPYASLATNPLDLTASFAGGPSETAVFLETLELLDRDERVDVVILAFVVMRRDFDDVLLPVMGAIRACQKPVVIISTGGSIADEGLRSLRGSGIPLFTSPARCAQAIRYLCDYAEFQRARQADPLRARRTKLPRRERSWVYPSGYLGPAETAELLTRYHIPFVRQELACTADEAVAVAEHLGYPVALKAVAPGLIHKTEAGGVRLGLRDGEGVASAFDDLTARLDASSVLVQEMVTDAVEMIVGLHHDPQFGPVVLLGAGGVLVELFRDRALRLPPLERAGVLQMLQELRIWRLLTGFRGRPPCDVETLTDLVLAVSRLAEELGEQVEALDLNPVMVLPAGQGCRVVDARVIWRGKDRGAHGVS